MASLGSEAVRTGGEATSAALSVAAGGLHASLLLLLLGETLGLHNVTAILVRGSKGLEGVLSLVDRSLGESRHQLLVLLVVHVCGGRLNNGESVHGLGLLGNDKVGVAGKLLLLLRHLHLHLHIVTTIAILSNRHGTPVGILLVVIELGSAAVKAIGRLDEASASGLERSGGGVKRGIHLVGEVVSLIVVSVLLTKAERVGVVAEIANGRRNRSVVGDNEGGAGRNGRARMAVVVSARNGDAEFLEFAV